MSLRRVATLLAVRAATRFLPTDEEPTEWYPGLEDNELWHWKTDDSSPPRSWLSRDTQNKRTAGRVWKKWQPRPYSEDDRWDKDTSERRGTVEGTQTGTR